jgi:hypothetical protein
MSGNRTRDDNIARKLVYLCGPVQYDGQSARLDEQPAQFREGEWAGAGADLRLDPPIQTELLIYICVSPIDNIMCILL